MAKDYHENSKKKKVYGNVANILKWANMKLKV